MGIVNGVQQGYHALTDTKTSQVVAIIRSTTPYEQEIPKQHDAFIKGPQADLVPTVLNLGAQAVHAVVDAFADKQYKTAYANSVAYSTEKGVAEAAERNASPAEKAFQSKVLEQMHEAMQTGKDPVSGKSLEKIDRAEDFKGPLYIGPSAASAPVAAAFSPTSNKM